MITLLAARVAATGRPLRDLAGVMTRLPQSLVNVKGVDKDAVDSSAPVQEAVRGVEERLAGAGRVLLRKSGTEPVVRVMVEAPTAQEAMSIANELADVVRAHHSL